MQSSAHEVSFEWKHHKLFSTDSKDKARAVISPRLVAPNTLTLCVGN